MKAWFPEVPHDIPAMSEMNIGKVGGGAASTDTANPARKQERRLLCNVITKAAADLLQIPISSDDPRLHVLEVDCFNHLRNVWLGGMSKALTKALKVTLKDELDAIDNRLRVSTSMESVLRATDKEFSLCANYPKGHGELFREWMAHNHPGALLLHVERTTGSRQDLCCEGSGAIYMNRVYYIEFLDERLRTCGAEGNILQENLFIIYSSMEMIAQTRVYSIIHLSIVLPMRWLAGNSHKLSEFDWSVRSNGRCADMLETALVPMEEDGYLLLDKEFMFGIFSELFGELPPFVTYLEYMFETKAMATIGSSTSDSLPLNRLRDELFDPQSEANKASDDIAVKLAVEAASALLEELRDETKATAQHLSSAEGRFSWEMTTWEMTTWEDHEQGRGSTP